MAPRACTRLRMYVPMPKSRMRRESMTMCSAILRPDGVEFPGVQRESRRQRADLLPHGGDSLLVGNVRQDFGDQGADFPHLGLAEAARSHRRRAQADPA